jgi:amidase
VGFKDHIAVAGLPLTFGCRALEHLVPDFDATVVARVLDAGGTLRGKNLLNGFTGLSGTSGEGDYGRPLNPHAVDHVTGGSSSGSAAAVAAGDVDISFGGDQGGSIRIPAAWCGVVGLKPTFGLVSHFGASFGWDQSLDYVGPMARDAEGVAAALEAVAGRDPLDPRQGPETPERLDVLGGLRDGVVGMRVGVLTEGFDDSDPEIAAAVEAAVDVLAAAGALVERISVPEHRSVGDALRALAPEGHRAMFETSVFGAFGRTYYPSVVIAEVHRVWHERPELLNPRTVLARLVAEFSRRTYRGAVYAKAQNVRETFARAYDRALEQVDVLVMPTAGITAPRYEPATLEATLGGGDQVARNTMPFNYTGHPALSVPCGHSGGLPVGMQLVGRRYDDALLLRVAHAYEHSVPA